MRWLLEELALRSYQRHGRRTLMLNSKIEQQRVSFHEIGAYITNLLPRWKLLGLNAFGRNCSVCAKAGAVGVGLVEKVRGDAFIICANSESTCCSPAQASSTFFDGFYSYFVSMGKKKKTFVKHSSAD
jgi:hypothetical protein